MKAANEIGILLCTAKGRCYCGTLNTLAHLVRVCLCDTEFDWYCANAFHDKMPVIAILKSTCCVLFQEEKRE